MAGGWHAVDHLSVAECVISPCGHIGDVPTALRADWARAHVQVFDYITEAQRRNDPLALERGLKWYLVLHDMLLRGARRTSRGGGRGTTYLAQRFDAWRRGDRLTLIRWLLSLIHI